MQQILNEVKQSFSSSVSWACLLFFGQHVFLPWKDFKILTHNCLDSKYIFLVQQISIQNSLGFKEKFYLDLECGPAQPY